MKNKYTAPELTIVQFRTERGFAQSNLQSFGTTIEMEDLWNQLQEVSGMNATGANTAGNNPLAANFGNQDVSGNGTGSWFGNSPWTSIEH